MQQYQQILGGPIMEIANAIGYVTTSTGTGQHQTVTYYPQVNYVTYPYIPPLQPPDLILKKRKLLLLPKP